jgi:hypothetical protein
VQSILRCPGLVQLKQRPCHSIGTDDRAMEAAALCSAFRRLQAFFFEIGGCCQTNLSCTLLAPAAATPASADAAPGLAMLHSEPLELEDDEIPSPETTGRSPAWRISEETDPGLDTSPTYR